MGAQVALVNKKCSEVKNFGISWCFSPFWWFQFLGTPLKMEFQGLFWKNTKGTSSNAQNIHNLVWILSDVCSDTQKQLASPDTMLPGILVSFGGGDYKFQISSEPSFSTEKKWIYCSCFHFFSLKKSCTCDESFTTVAHLVKFVLCNLQVQARAR